jgi:hypothetical protein
MEHDESKPEAMDKRKADEIKQKKHDLRILSASVILYLLCLGGIFGYALDKGAYWAMAGLILGLIFFAVSTYYFFDTFVRPYLTEKVSHPRHHHGIKFWSIEWVGPIAFIQLFIVLGFWIAIACCPLPGTVFTHPIQYSQFYHSLLKHEAPIQNFSSYIELKKVMKKEAVEEKTEQKKEPVSTEEAVHDVHKVPFLIAFSFGFLGSLVYSLFDIARRFYTADLLPKTLVGYVVRFILSVSVCVVIAYGLIAFDLPNYYAFPFLFFFIGAFPERGLRWIKSSSERILGQSEMEKPMSLCNIEGMTDYMVYRFREIGIEDIQHLAFSDLNHLMKYLGFSERLLCDFVSQALLMILAGKQYDELRDKYGIRDVVSFREIMTVNAGHIEKTASNPQMLAGLLHVVQTDSMFVDRIKNIENCVKECEKQESKRLREAAG